MYPEAKFHIIFTQKLPHWVLGNLPAANISKEDFFMNIGILILMIIGGGVGVLSSLYIALSFPAVIIWKIFRKIRHGYKITY